MSGQEPSVNINGINMKNTVEHSVGIQEAEIGVVAYQMWERAGHPTGRDLQFWLEAETRLRAAAKVTPIAGLSQVASGNGAGSRTASVELGPPRPHSAKAQRNSRKS
jgi:hypothetical protein